MTGGSTETAAQRSECAVAHPYERRAVVLLAQAGWSQSELAMVFETSKSSIQRLLVSETEVSA